MNFTQDFAGDLESMDFFSTEPWALIRFGDGERHIMEGNPITITRGHESWSFEELDEWLSRKLFEALTCDFANFGIGISCPCCDLPSHEFYLKYLRCPKWQITYSNIFVNANHDRLIGKINEHGQLEDFVYIGASKLANYEIPTDLPNQHHLIEKCIDWLLEKNPQFIAGPVRKCVLVAAGPASNIIIHEYWKRCEPTKRATIVDIGSALDPLVHKEATRYYHLPMHENRGRQCRWS